MTAVEEAAELAGLLIFLWAPPSQVRLTSDHAGARLMAERLGAGPRPAERPAPGRPG